MKTFLVNLDKCTDRLECARRRLNALGIEFERIQAVYGKDLTDEDRHLAVDRFRWWCAQGRKIRDGEIGCALSHKLIYERMIEENIPICCVLEDDNCYRDDFKQIVDSISRMVDVSRPQVILLSNCSDDCPRSDKVQIICSKGDQWTSSYLITLPAARAILCANYPIQVPCDYWRRWVGRGLIELYHAFPTVAVQAGNEKAARGIPLDCAFQSDIECGEVFRVDALSMVQKIFHKVKRLIGVSIDAVLPLRRPQ